MLIILDGLPDFHEFRHRPAGKATPERLALPPESRLLRRDAGCGRNDTALLATLIEPLEQMGQAGFARRLEVATGTRTGFPSGRMPASSPRTAKITVTRRRTRGSFLMPSRAVCKWMQHSPSLHTRTSSIICGRRNQCRSRFAIRPEPTFRPTARAIPRRPRRGTQASQVLRARRGRTLVPAE